MYELPVPDDFHLHLRQGPQLAGYVRDAAAQFGRALVMPNTVPPIVTPAALTEYRDSITAAVTEHRFEPLMSFKLAEEYGPAEVEACAEAGAVAAKYYPRGATTNSEDGIADLHALYPALEALEERDIVLCLHGEAPEAFCLDRERAFLPRLEELAARFPRLRIVLEHISSAAGLRTVRALPETVAGTITAHHLLLTLDDLIGGLLNPHHFCKPVVKTPQDREALLEAAVGGEERFFFGSDSAPHLRSDKECACGCAGVYSSPVAIGVLAEAFEKNLAREVAPASQAGLPLWVERLRGFICENGARFYRLSAQSERIILRQEDWRVPEQYHDVVPLRSGERLRWLAERV